MGPSSLSLLHDGGLLMQKFEYSSLLVLAGTVNNGRVFVKHFLQKIVFAHTFPSTFLIPFLVEPFITICLYCLGTA